MTYKTDCGGTAFKCNDLKVYSSRGGSTWGTKIWMKSRMKGHMHIVTYSLPDMDYVIDYLGRRPYDISLIANAKFRQRAEDIKRKYPLISVATHGKVHSKYLLLAPHTTYITSANFGYSRWHETGIGLHSVAIYESMLVNFHSLWGECDEIYD